MYTNVFTKNEEVYMPRSIFFLFFDLLEVRKSKISVFEFCIQASRQKCASPQNQTELKITQHTIEI